MTSTAARPASRPSRPPPWRDVRLVRIVAQILFLAAVVVLLLLLADTLRTNLRRSGLPMGFEWLDRPAGVDIRDTDFRPSQPVRDALLVGFINTIRVAIVGIALATIVGIVVGIARLSSNWIVRKGAALYVETLRNVPVLILIIFAYTAVVLRLPPITEAAEALGIVVFSNRVVAVPWYEAAGAARTFLALLALGAVVALAVGWWRTRRFDETGQPHHRVLWGLGALLAVAAAAFVALDAPVALSLPTREGRRVTGGIGVGPEYTALLAALVVYTASHIAEIVRGSILAVPKGQTEAAQAIALTGFQRMRFVVLPQAFRIMVPPLANQYLNLTKNSSLAVAIGYMELTRLTGQVIANGNPAPQAIALLMLGYLVLSLATSAVTNVINRRLRIGGRG